MEKVKDRVAEKSDLIENLKEKEDENYSDLKDDIEDVRDDLSGLNSGDLEERVAKIEESAEGLEKALEEAKSDQDVEEVRNRLDDLEESIREVETQVDQEDLRSEVDDIRGSLNEIEDDISGLHSGLSDNESDIEDFRVEIDERLEKLKSDIDSGSDVPEDFDFQRIGELEVSLDNLETRVDKLESRESQEMIKDIREELDQVKSIVSDFKWLFNDFDDLSELKLLSVDEYEEIKAQDAGQDDVKNLFQSVDERLSKIIDVTSSAEDVKKLEERVERIEQSVDQPDDKLEEDLEAIVSKIESQDKEIREIREGYTELGEMMQLLLNQHRSDEKKDLEVPEL